VQAEAERLRDALLEGGSPLRRGDAAARRRAVDALDRALRGLREQLRRPGDTAPRPERDPALKRS
jgi:hypothetical protein